MNFDINAYTFIIFLSGVVIMAFIFNLISKKLRIPTVLLLIGTGMVLGEFNRNYEIISDALISPVLEVLGIMGLMIIVQGGRFGGWGLYVKDGIKTERVKVEVASTNGWADYVFNDDYKLASLKEVEEFINKNKHLPEVPSENEVLENGIELQEMNILLLKKIEELTLYIIELNEKLEEQQELIEKQQKLLESKIK